MSTETISNAAVAEHNRTVARRWIDAFNDDDDAEARTADYIAHAPDSDSCPPRRLVAAARAECL